MSTVPLFDASALEPTPVKRVSAKQEWEEFTGKPLPGKVEVVRDPLVKCFIEMYEMRHVLRSVNSDVGDAWRKCPEEKRLAFRAEIRKLMDYLYVDSFAGYSGAKSKFRMTIDGKILPCRSTKILGAKKEFARHQATAYEEWGNGKLEVLAPNGEWIEVFVYEDLVR